MVNGWWYRSTLKIVVFTSFSKHEPKFNERRMEYMVFKRERCPNTGRKYFQGFISLKKSHRLYSCKKIVSNTHFDRVHGTIEENINYCTEDNEFT